MAVASPNECSAANALVSEERTFDAESSDMNGTLDREHAIAERWARRPFRRAA